VAILSVGSFFSGLGGPTTWAATMDISGKHTAIGFSLMNMSGNLGAIVCPIVVGYLIAYLTRTGESWDAVLYLFAANYLAAAICWLLLDPNQSAVERTSKIPG
jgi:MFS family permease